MNPLPEASAPETLPQHWASALFTLISSRLALLQAESKEVIQNLVRRIVFLVVGGILLFFMWILLLAGSVGAIAHFGGWPWYWVTLGVAALHLVLGLIFLKSGKSSSPTFPISRAEFTKDREWIHTLKAAPKSND